MDIKKFFEKNFTFVFVCIVILLQILIYIKIKKMAQNYRRENYDDNNGEIVDINHDVL